MDMRGRQPDAKGAYIGSFTLDSLARSPKGMHIHHTCEVKHCVNPDHLQMLTPGEHNKETRRLHGNNHFARKKPLNTHCQRGHLLDEANTYVGKKSGKRTCKICVAANHKKYKDRIRSASKT